MSSRLQTILGIAASACIVGLTLYLMRVHCLVFACQ
jgi:hypothetical protein